MSDARKRAEEWLGRYGDDDPLTLYGLENSRVEAARLLRALLAEEPGAANFIRCAVPRGECCHQRIPAVLPLEAPECNDGDDCCRYCGRGLQPCGACKPEAPNPGERQCYFCDCTTTHTPEECMRRSRRKPAPPLPPEVREALLAEVPPMSAATPGGFHTRAKEWLARRDTVGHLAETPEVGIIRALLADNDVAAKRVPCGDPDCLCGISPEVHSLRKLTGQVMMAVRQVAEAGDPDARTKAVEVLTETRKKLYGILAETD